MSKISKYGYKYISCSVPYEEKIDKRNQFDEFGKHFPTTLFIKEYSLNINFRLTIAILIYSFKNEISVFISMYEGYSKTI